MWAFFLKLIFNKYVLGGLAALALFIAVEQGIESIRSAYTQRAALQKQTADQIIEIASMQEQKKLDDQAATEAADKLKKELDDREAAAAKQAARSEQLQKDLSNAKVSISKWRATASANLTACLNTPLPDGLFPGADKAGPAAAGSSKDGVRPAAAKPAPKG